MQFKEILRKIMVEKNLTQQRLADKIGVKQSQVSEWLKGKSIMGYNNIKQMCIALEISADIVLGLK